jgi:type VI secretion system protein ImpM
MIVYANQLLGDRENQEDAYICNLNLRLFAVCDGMGGHRKGELASQTATQAINRHCLNKMAFNTNRAQPALQQEALRSALYFAHEQINLVAEMDESAHGMMTTATAMLFGAHMVSYIHVGDCSLFQFRRGVFLPVFQTTVQGFAHMTAGIGGGLSAKELEPDMGSTEYQPGDRFLLVSDGVTKVLSIPYIAQVMQGSDLRRTGERMLHTPVRLGKGESDNITVIIVEV